MPSYPYGQGAALLKDRTRSFATLLPPAFVHSNRARKRHPRSHLLETARRQSARARGCHLFGRVPFRIAGQSLSRVAQLTPLHHFRATRVGSFRSSAWAWI